MYSAWKSTFLLRRSGLSFFPGVFQRLALFQRLQLSSIFVSRARLLMGRSFHYHPVLLLFPKVRGNKGTRGKSALAKLSTATATRKLFRWETRWRLINFPSIYTDWAVLIKGTEIFGASMFRD